MANNDTVLTLPDETIEWFVKGNVNDETKFSAPTEEHAANGYKAEFPSYNEWNYMFKRFGQLYNYTKWFTGNYFDNLLIDIKDKIDQWLVSTPQYGNNIRVYTTTVGLDQRQKIALRLFNGNWYDDTNIGFDTNDLPLYFDTLNDSQDNWNFYSKTNLDGSVVENSKPLAKNLSLYFYILYAETTDDVTNEITQYSKFLASTSKDPIDVVSAFRTVNELSGDTPIYYRRMGATATYQFTVSPFKVFMTPVVQNGDRFYTEGDKVIDVIEAGDHIINDSWLNSGDPNLIHKEGSTTEKTINLTEDYGLAPALMDEYKVSLGIEGGISGELNFTDPYDINRAGVINLRIKSEKGSFVSNEWFDTFASPIETHPKIHLYKQMVKFTAINNSVILENYGGGACDILDLDVQVRYWIDRRDD